MDNYYESLQNPVEEGHRSEDAKRAIDGPSPIGLVLEVFCFSDFKGLGV